MPGALRHRAGRLEAPGADRDAHPGAGERPTIAAPIAPAPPVTTARLGSMCVDSRAERCPDRRTALARRRDAFARIGRSG